MHIIVGLILALVLLYFWLLGHWFARILTFLLLAAMFGVIGAMLTGMEKPPEASHGWVGLLLGAALAWPVAGIPIYYWRHEIRKIEAS